MTHDTAYSFGYGAVGSCTQLPALVKAVQANARRSVRGGASPAAAMPPEEEGMLVRGARLGCCMLAGGAVPEGRISVVGPAAQGHGVAGIPQ